MASVTAAAARELLQTLASRFDAITISSNFFPLLIFHPCWPRKSTNHPAMVLQLTGSPNGCLPSPVQILKCFFNLQHVRFVGYVRPLCGSPSECTKKSSKLGLLSRCDSTRFSGCCADFFPIIKSFI
jgi:hypothetical protein